MKQLSVLTVLAVVLFGRAGSAAPIVLTNAGFETGDLTGWSSTGDVVATASTSVTTFDSTVWSIFAAGTTMAQLDPSVGVGGIEALLGIAAGTLAAADPTQGLTDGAAIYQEFTGAVGDTVSMYWDYVARDYIPFNDPAYALVIGPDGVVEVLASIYGAGIAVGTSGHSGWQLFSHTLVNAGTHTLAFVTTNSGDTILDSALFLDNAPGSCDPTCPPTVPEPGAFWMLGVGLLPFVRGLIRRRG